jgi:hypothetical protein
MILITVLLYLGAVSEEFNSNLMAIPFCWPQQLIKHVPSCESWGFHGGENDDVLLGVGALQTRR